MKKAPNLPQKVRGEFINPRYHPNSALARPSASNKAFAYNAAIRPVLHTAGQTGSSGMSYTPTPFHQLAPPAGSLKEMHRSYSRHCLFLYSNYISGSLRKCQPFAGAFFPSGSISFFRYARLAASRARSTIHFSSPPSALRPAGIVSYTSATMERIQRPGVIRIE